ncbi:hypothetical protein TRVL_07951 [Trypanosoma vivax]|nr:hypothetical protein TRVL_07951 [Trypanosoma vivax]
MFLSASSGEFATLCLFMGLKRAFSSYISGVAFSRQQTELFTSAMLKLFDRIISLLLFTSRTNRHFVLLDAFQTYWSGQINKCPSETLENHLSENKPSEVVFEEDTWFKRVEEDSVFYVHNEKSIEFVFSDCVTDPLRSDYNRSRSLACINIQRCNTLRRSDSNHEGDIYGSYSKYSNVPVISTMAIGEANIDNKWIFLTIPVDTAEESTTIEHFLRNETEISHKKCIDSKLISFCTL